VPAQHDHPLFEVNVGPLQVAQLARPAAGVTEEDEHLTEAGACGRLMPPAALARVDLPGTPTLLPDGGVPEEFTELLVSERPAGLALRLLDAAERIGGDESLLRGPVERPHDDRHNLGLRPVAHPLRMLRDPLLDVDGQAILVVDFAEAVGLGEELQVAA